MTLEDGDVPPETIVLSVDPGLVSEGDSATTVTVTAAFDGVARAGPTELTGSVGAESDSATETSDYQAVAGFRLTIPAGMRSGTGTFTLTPIDDTLGESDERISVSGSASGFHVTGTGVTLSDNETVSTGVTLRAAPASIGEDDVAKSVTVTATLDDAVRPEATTVTVSVGARQDGATEGTDYVVVGGMTILIPAGMTSGAGTFTLTPRDDDLAEGDELVSLEGTTTAPGLSVIGAVVTITDDEATPTRIVLSATPPSLRENGGEQAAILTARLDGGARGLATVVTVQVGDGADTATKGVDYGTVPSFEVTIPSGSRLGTAPFRLAPTDDSTYEGSESISVKGAASPALAVTGTVTASLIGGVWDRPTLVEVAVAGGGDEEAVDFSPVSGFEILIPATESSAAASFTLIPEDDDASSRSIRLTVDRERVSEGAGPAVITVTATLDRSARTEDTPVQIVLSDSGLAEAVDYSAVREFGLTIPKDQLSGSVQFTLIPEDDRIDERDETIEVAGSSVLPVSPALVLLEDDDGASQAIVLSLDQDVILENAGPTLVAVTAALDRSGRTEDTPVRIEVLGSGTPGAVRFAPVDALDLTIRAGELSGAGTFTMTPLISILKSSPETVEVRGASDLPVVPAALLLVDVDTGEVPAGWLERFARTVASQTVDLVRERLDGMVGGGNQLTLFGYRLFGGYGGQPGGPYGGPVFSSYGLLGSAGPAGQVRAGPLPVGAASAGGGWLGGQGPFGYSGHGGAVALSSSLGQLATWGDRAPRQAASNSSGRRNRCSNTRPVPASNRAAGWRRKRATTSAAGLAATGSCRTASSWEPNRANAASVWAPGSTWERRST